MRIENSHSLFKTVIRYCRISKISRESNFSRVYRKLIYVVGIRSYGSCSLSNCFTSDITIAEFYGSAVKSRFSKLKK